MKSGFSSRYTLIEKKALKQHKYIEDLTLFNAFDEGITDFLTCLALPKNISKKSGYPEEVAMVDSIIANVYGQEGFKEFIKNYFSGKMMHLRKVEKFYGKSSLKYLAYLQTRDYYEKNFNDNKNSLKKALEGRKKIIEFFTTKDELVREKLRKELF
jgi:hypothetical protein